MGAPDAAEVLRGAFAAIPSDAPPGDSLDIVLEAFDGLVALKDAGSRPTIEAFLVSPTPVVRRRAQIALDKLGASAEPTRVSPDLPQKKRAWARTTRPQFDVETTR